VYIYIYIYIMEINSTDNGSIAFFGILVILVDYGDRCIPSDSQYGKLVGELTIWCAAVILWRGLCKCC
jgi:hypothetical protein